MKRISVVILFALLLPVIVLASKDPADHPLVVHILHTAWRSDGRGVYSGWGRGNIKDGQSVHGFDFSYFGCAPFRETVGANQMYPGKWKKDDLQLEILVAEIGKVDKFASCDLKTSVIEGVYFRGPGGLTALSQQQFKEYNAKRDANLARSQQGTNPASPMSRGARLSITSTPPGADIEVDGSLMGNTPSSIDLAAGEHKVAIRKQGFRLWERQVKVAGGVVNLNAELEKDIQK